jgi:hypothetical protein
LGSGVRVVVGAALLAVVGGCYGTPRTSFPDDPKDGGGGSGIDGAAGATGGGRGGSSGATGMTGGAAGSLGRGGSGGAGGDGSGGRGGGAVSGISGAGGLGGAGGRAGSSAGSGGGTGKALGQSCAGDAECGSGHCAGSVCCDQACTGICQQCSSGGQCQMPADDPACGTITCPTDSTCRDYASAISTNRCKTRGQCKTAADCSYVNAPSSVICGYVRGMSEIAASTCDAMGNCRARTVKCGGDGECAIDQAWCCVGDGGGLTCQAAECGGTPKLGPFLCDEQADCAVGYVCCLQSTPGGPSAVCFTAAQCVSDVVSTREYACNPAVSPSECPTGTSCLPAISGPIGWYVCR